MASPAPCCKKALADATARYPNRNRASDGIMGDANHKARKSDHNLGNAFDLTHDPNNGVDCGVLSRLVMSDKRITYIIWNREIYVVSKASKGWQKYVGTNPHTKHMHVSIRNDARDDLSAWAWSPGEKAILVLPPAKNSPQPPSEVLKLGSRGKNVIILQTRLNHHGAKLIIDGDFGKKTHQAVLSFQKRRGLKEDGIVGKLTWATLFKN